MRIGIDLDNTLVCYDPLFWTLAVERGWISASIPPRKEKVRDELRRLGREADWTWLQGEVYGSRMAQAAAFPQAVEMVTEFRRRSWQAFVISHRTKTPFAGPEYDLHAAARTWLEYQRIVCETGIAADGVYLETSKANKLARIGSLQLDWFIDDLPELLLDPAFPAGVRRVLFDPHRHHPPMPAAVLLIHDLGEIAERIARETSA